MISRIVSGAIAIAYVVMVYRTGGGEDALELTIFLVLPLACIWYSEEMGSYPGVIRLQAITSKTPGCMVAFGGWLLLFVPVVIWIIALCSGDK